MLKILTVSVISILLLLTSTVIVFAQEEESFIREAVMSKRDAVVLSAIFPGLGQMTQGQKVKGITFFMGAAASLIVTINSHENYSTKQKTYEKDIDTFYDLTSGGSYPEALKEYNDLKKQKDDLDSLNIYRDTFLIIAGGIYAYNLIDAIFFSSSYSESRRAERDNDKITVSSVMIDRSPGLLLSKRF